MADTFALQLAAFAQKAGGNARQVVRHVSIDLATKVVLRTPVGDPTKWKGKAPAGYVGGRARANWGVSIGHPDFTVTAAVDKSGQPTIAKATAAISASDGVQPIYIMNSVPYIRPLEYEDHSQQAPAGMVRVTVTEFQAFVDNAVAGLPK